MWSNMSGEVKLGEADYTIFWDNAEKISTKSFFFTFLIKPRTYDEYHVRFYICTKFDGFSLTNEPRNTKIGLLIKWAIKCIFNEAEPPQLCFPI